MSSKSKKKSKSSSKTSPASSLSSSFSPATPSTSNRPNTAAENELNEADFALVLEEASRKFPSLIAKTAFIGRLLASDANLASDEMVKKGTTVWVSKSALEASSIKPNSFVSVSLAPLNLSFGTQPLCSIIDECAKNLGIARNEEFTHEAGNYFALAIVKPSTELVKSDVLLSPNLLLTIGCPSSGRVVFIYPVHERPLESNLRVHDDAIGCEELHLTLASLTSTSTVDGAPSSNHGDSITNRDDNENGKISSSPRTPLYTKLRPSYGSGKIKTDSFQQKTSVTTNDVMEMLSDDSLRKILQACSVSWLLFRSLLIGNIVFIPLLSRHCGFLVVGAKNLLSDGEHLGEQFAGHLISQHSDRVDNGCVEYYVGKRTKVFLHLPGSSISRSLMENPVQSVHLNGDVTDIKTRDFPKLAGLDKEYEVLKEIIIASSVRGALARMGLRPTKGVLIHGPPGTGKTSLARLCAHDAGVHLFTVNGPEIVTQYYGESERALHDVFDSASKALPSVVFIDELDAIAPARKDGGEELSQRLVATLLNLMDGISRTDGLVVVAATNRPDSIDSALRRPGRLDREIEISVPSPKQRLGILVSILSEMENTLTDTDIEHLAGATHGFVGADLAALCNEAAMVCLRRYSNINTSFEHASCNLRSNSYCSNDVVENGFGVEDSEGISEESIDDLTSSTSRLDVAAETEVNDDRTTKKHALSLSPDDFERARMKVRPSAMREVILEVPKVKWEDIGGQREVKMQLIEAVEWPQKHHEAFKRIGTQPPTGVLLFGPPGCSKTLLARAVASEAGLNFLAVKGPELFSKWVGESEKAVRSLFAKARANAPSIIFFDEIDGLAVIRGKESDGVSVSDRVMSQLLVELDGLHQRVNVTVIAATNRPDKIDPALLRPGRFDRLLFVGPPDQYDREDIFRVHLKKMPCGSDVSLKELSLLTEGYTGADISLICREAAITAIEEDFNATEITGEHLKAAILKVEPSDVESYDDLSNRFQRLVGSKNHRISKSESSHQ